MKKKIFTRPISVNLPESVFQQIYKITEKEEVSISEFVRDAVETKLSMICNEKEK